MPDARGRNPFFPLTILFGGAFVVTILALVACLFGDERAPMARLFDQYAGWMLAVEVVATLVMGFLALAVDRRQTLLREKHTNENDVDLRNQVPGEPGVLAPGSSVAATSISSNRASQLSVGPRGNPGADTPGTPLP